MHLHLGKAIQTPLLAEQKLKTFTQICQSPGFALTFLSWDKSSYIVVFAYVNSPSLIVCYLSTFAFRFPLRYAAVAFPATLLH